MKTTVKFFDLATMGTEDRISQTVYKCLASYKNDFTEAVKNGSAVAKLKGYERTIKEGEPKVVKNFSSDQVILASQIFEQSFIKPMAKADEKRKMAVIPQTVQVPVFDADGNDTGKTEPVLEFSIMYAEPNGWEIDTRQMPTDLLVAGRKGGSAKAGQGSAKGEGAENPTTAEGKKTAIEQDADEYEKAMKAMVDKISNYCELFKISASQKTNFENWLTKELCVNIIVFKPIKDEPKKRNATHAN